jgi:hypothetical protein
MSNPFATGVPTEAQPAAPANPFAGAAPAAPAATAPAQAPANPYAQQQAAPAAQQYAQPNPYAAPAQQQYAPPAPAAPQQQYAAPAQQAPAAVPQFGTAQAAPPPVVGEGRGAKLPDMFGRLVLLFPLSLSRVPRNPQYITAEQRAAGNVEQDRLTATVVVLDAGAVGRMDAIQFGGAPYALPPTPHTDSAPLPYVRKGMWINQSRLISQARDFLPGAAMGGPNGAPGMIAGRVHKAGPNQNDPWYLIAATPDEVALANKYLELVQQGVYPNPLG